MKLLPLAVSLPSLLVLLIQFSHSASILDTINFEKGFIKAAKEIVSAVRSDIDELDKDTKIDVMQHFKSVSSQVEQIKKLHSENSEKYSYVAFAHNIEIIPAISELSDHFVMFQIFGNIPSYLLRFTESLTGLRIDPYKDTQIDPKSINVFYLELHGAQCEHTDEKCRLTMWYLNSLPQIYKELTRCDQRQSPKELLHSIHNHIALGELMAYVLIEYSMAIQRTSGNGNIIAVRNTVRRNYDEITQRNLNTLRNLTETDNLFLRRCDPREHIDNETFDVIQLYEENGDRYFNLRESLSDVKANKVVTGVRFVKKNRIFHLQIQQGELLPRGLINESTVEWKPIDNYEISNSNVKEGVDYHTLSDQSRAIDLDDLKTDDKTFVVTGVRFHVRNGHLNLKIRFSKFDFDKGELIDAELNSMWQSKENVNNRQQLHLDNLNLPVRATESLQISKDTQYLEFTNSMYDDYEDSQLPMTIPYIDIQDVEYKPSMPLAGIGIYHKGKRGFGGFVAPKIISYDFSPHLLSNIY